MSIQEKNETEEKKTFLLGGLVYSKGVDILRGQDKKFRRFVRDSLEQYKACDWGFTGPEGKVANERALENGGECILGEYRHPDHPEWTIWFLTESDRSMTTAVFPEECAYAWEGVQVAGPKEIESAFREAVDEYLSLCKELGKEPDRKQTTYLARVQRTNDGWFAIDFPDLPGTHAQCHSLYEIQAEAHRCLRSYLDAARTLNMDIPEPGHQISADELEEGVTIVAEGMMIVAVTA